MLKIITTGPAPYHCTVSGTQQKWNKNNIQWTHRRTKRTPLLPPPYHHHLLLCIHYIQRDRSQMMTIMIAMIIFLGDVMVVVHIPIWFGVCHVSMFSVQQGKYYGCCLFLLLIYVSLVLSLSAHASYSTLLTTKRFTKNSYVRQKFFIQGLLLLLCIFSCRCSLITFPANENSFEGDNNPGRLSLSLLLLILCNLITYYEKLIGKEKKLHLYLFSLCSTYKNDDENNI